MEKRRTAGAVPDKEKLRYSMVYTIYRILILFYNYRFFTACRYSTARTGCWETISI